VTYRDKDYSVLYHIILQVRSRIYLILMNRRARAFFKKKKEKIDSD